MGYILAFSILLHLFTIFAIVVLYKRYSLGNENGFDHTNSAKTSTIQEQLEQYLDETEQDQHEMYERLVNHMKSADNRWQAAHDALQRKLTEQDVTINQLQHKLQKLQDNFVQYEVKHSAVDSHSKQEQSNVNASDNDPFVHTQMNMKNLDNKANKDNHSQLAEQIKQDNIDTLAEQQSHKKQNFNIDNEQSKEDTEQYARVEELARQGFSAPQIAKLLNLGTGETQLIVNMIKKSNKKTNK